MMMLKQLFISNLFRLSGLFIIIILLIPVCVFSKEDVQKGPIVVTSKMLTIDNEKNTAVFFFFFVAKAPEMTLYADKMLIFYNQDTRTITRIDALGRVKVVDKKRVITADEATYYARDERVIFRGDLQVVEEKPIVLDEKNTPSR
jgi:lipopolysaccharide export system protein LptA